MARSSPGAGTDVTYIGFLLGHGGDALQMLDLASGVHQRGVSVRIIVPEVPESVTFAERCRSLGLDCRRSDLLKVSSTSVRQNPLDLVRVFRSVRSPIVHFHTGNSCLPRTTMSALTLLRFPKSFVTLHSAYETIDSDSARARFWAATARRRFLAVCSPSDHATRFQNRCGVPPTVTTTVRNAIDADAWRSGDASGPRAALGVNATDPLIVFSSRLDNQKRPYDALRIFAAIADEFPDARLVFVGQGEHSEGLGKEAADRGLTDRVHLVGYRTDIKDWLAAATVWILPTERENFSVAVLEALAAGCAILSTNCPGNDEVLVDGDNSLTFEIGDVAAGAEKMRSMLADQSLRERLQSNAITTSGRFSVDRMVESYLDLYRSSPDAPPSLSRRAVR